ncbi:MAG: hypothetical protein M0R80_04730 [Proteobacteria bacterium]|jgi:hypothetical protein|nr:hypothetical protein [Pseudomonadota bacterium]
MSRHATTIIGLCAGALLTLGVLGAAGADEPLALRWIPTGTKTALSGIPYNDDVSHVRINATMGTKPEDRYYAIRGIRTSGGNFGIQVVPAFLHPAADRNVRNDWFRHSDPTNVKTAELPEGYFVTSLQMCDDGDTDETREFKGVRVWGHRLDSLGRTLDPKGPVELTRTGCKQWRAKVSCPSGTIAHSLLYHNLSALQLFCSKVEPAVGVWNPWSGRVLDGGYFKDGTGKIHVKLQAKNDSHTTGNVELATVKLMSGGAAVCQAKVAAQPAIPYGHTQDLDLGLPCDWQKIKTAGGCKLGDSCSVKLKGIIKAKVEGLVEEHPYETTVTLKHIP